MQRERQTEAEAGGVGVSQRWWCWQSGAEWRPGKPLALLILVSLAHKKKKKKLPEQETENVRSSSQEGSG